MSGHLSRAASGRRWECTPSPAIWLMALPSEETLSCSQHLPGRPARSLQGPTPAPYLLSQRHQIRVTEKQTALSIS